MIQSNEVKGLVRTSWPHWSMRGRIRKVGTDGIAVKGEYAYAGEFVRISPRFIRGGTNFRVRPERPSAFFAAWSFENGLLPSPLTPEETQEAWALELLDALWEANQACFPKLESPNAACDTDTTPSHRTGFSFCVLQVLVEPAGTVRNTGGTHGSRATTVNPPAPQNLDALRQKIEAMRKAARPDTTPPKKK